MNKQSFDDANRRPRWLTAFGKRVLHKCSKINPGLVLAVYSMSVSAMLPRGFVPILPVSAQSFHVDKLHCRLTISG